MTCPLKNRISDGIVIFTLVHLFFDTGRHYGYYTAVAMTRKCKAAVSKSDRVYFTPVKKEA